MSIAAGRMPTPPAWVKDYISNDATNALTISYMGQNPINGEYRVALDANQATGRIAIEVNQNDAPYFERAMNEKNASILSKSSGDTVGDTRKYIYHADMPDFFSQVRQLNTAITNAEFSKQSPDFDRGRF